MTVVQKRALTRRLFQGQKKARLMRAQIDSFNVNKFFWTYSELVMLVFTFSSVPPQVG